MHSFGHRNKSAQYRPEIDGLRAFAVVAVIVNHIRPALLPGGYLGVDIFFVISGYVITSSLANRKSNDIQDFISSFYARRVKRLVPALSVFALVTSAAICLFNPTPNPSLKTALASLFGVANIQLLNETTKYFGESAKLNAFTHTWSLGVEEQFYILFPFLTWFSGFSRHKKNGPRNLFLTLTIVGFSSLIYYIYLSNSNESAAYFLMPSRLWEMAVGSLLFIGLQKRLSIEMLIEKIPPIIVLLLVIGVMCLPRSGTTWVTISIVLLSAILITSLKKHTAAYQIFTHPKIVYIGLISYSLYLWHWGVLAISRFTIGITFWVIPFQIALMFGLAAASYRYIETPLRKDEWFGNRSYTLITGAAILIATSTLLYGLGKPFKGILFLGKRTIPPQWEWPEKFVPNSNWDEPFLNGNVCLRGLSSDTQCFFFNNHSKKTLWLIGDSHASALFKAAITAAYAESMNFKLYTAGGTAFPPISHFRKTEKNRDLKKVSDFRLLYLELLSNLGDGDAVLIGMRLPYHFGGTNYEYPWKDFVYLDSDGSHGTQRDYFDKWVSAVQSLSNQAKKVGAKVIIQTPTPEWRSEVLGKCNNRETYWFNYLVKENCQTKSSFFTDYRNGIYRDLFREIKHLAKSNDSILLLDTYSIVCPGEICSYSINQKDIYADDDHIDVGFAHGFVTPELRKLLSRMRKHPDHAPRLLK